MSAIDTSVPITLIGLGSIGVSFAALYLTHSSAPISVYDPREDLREHIESVLPGYLNTSDPGFSVDHLVSTGRLRICSSLEDACKDAFIVQEQGPENLKFKSSIWKEVVKFVSPETHLWSSTSGIPASRQIADLDDKSRLLVVHPYNPAHIMPLLEISPSPHTSPERATFAKSFFEALNSGHKPVVLKKEVPGFVGNRLAFVLFREACHLVSEGVVSVEDLDIIVENSIGARWAVAGPMKTYHYGGGVKGLDGFLKNLSGTVEDIWDDAGEPSFKGTTYLPNSEASGDVNLQKSWANDVVEQTNQAYGLPTTADFTRRDQALRRILKARDEKEG